MNKREMIMKAVGDGHTTGRSVAEAIDEPRLNVENYMATLAVAGALLVVGKENPTVGTGRAHRIYALNPAYVPPAPPKPKADPQKAIEKRLERIMAAERRRARIEARRAMRMNDKPDTMDSATDFAAHAMPYWPDVKKMQTALQHASKETRRAAIRIILEHKRA